MKDGDAQDWDALSTMKKDLGMKVDFVSPTDQKEADRAASAGWEGHEKWHEKKLGEAKEEAAETITKILSQPPAYAAYPLPPAPLWA